MGDTSQSVRERERDRGGGGGYKTRIVSLSEPERTAAQNVKHQPVGEPDGTDTLPGTASHREAGKPREPILVMKSSRSP